MPYAKGQSGNPKGRPKQTAEQKSQKEQFQRLLKSSTVEALQSIIQIANQMYAFLVWCLYRLLQMNLVFHIKHFGRCANRTKSCILSPVISFL